MVADFKKKQKSELSEKRFWLRAAGIALISVSVVLIVSDFRIYRRKKELIAQIDAYSEQIKEIKDKNANLKEEIANSENPDYIEKAAREEVDMQKPGEEVVSFIMPEKKQEINQKKNIWENSVMFSWIGRSWNWIKSKF